MPNRQQVQGVMRTLPKPGHAKFLLKACDGTQSNYLDA